MSKIKEGYYKLSEREKFTILELMEDHPELSKREMAAALGITPLTLAKKQKEYGVFVKDKRGRTSVKVDTSPVTMTEVPQFQTGVKDEGEE